MGYEGAFDEKKIKTLVDCRDNGAETYAIKTTILSIETLCDSTSPQLYIVYNLMPLIHRLIQIENACFLSLSKYKFRFMAK